MVVHCFLTMSDFRFINFTCNGVTGYLRTIMQITIIHGLGMTLNSFVVVFGMALNSSVIART